MSNPPSSADGTPPKPPPAGGKPKSPPPDLTMMPPVRTPTPRPGVASPGMDMTMMPPATPVPGGVHPAARPGAAQFQGAEVTMLPPATPTPRPGAIRVPPAKTPAPAAFPGDMTMVAPAPRYPTPRPGSDAQTIVMPPPVDPQATLAVDPAATVAGYDTNVLAAQAGQAASQASLPAQAMRAASSPEADPLVVTLDAGLQQSRRSVLATLTTTGDGGGNWRRTLRLPSSTSDGRFSIRRKLAAGGMGAVLEIADQDFGRNAAMKVIKPEARAHPDALVRFLAEARVTAQLEHPNIVPIHDLGTMGDGTLYFTMKFIQGLSFGQVVKKLKEGDAVTRAQWGENAILLAFLKVLDGVGFAHARKVVHRDLKPDNVMIGAHGEVLVVDWGIAKVAGQAEHVPAVPTDATILSGDEAGLTMQGQAMGTPMYMPPEQAKGDLAAIDARSDIYALGATLYELITLRKSIDADTITSLLFKVTHGDIVPVRSAKPDIDADLAAIITKAMALAPERRYQSCEEFAADIRLYLSGCAVAARRRSLAEALRAWVVTHRKQLVVGAISAGTIALLAGGYVYWRDLEEKRQVQKLLAAARSDLEQGQLVQDKGTYDLDKLKKASGEAYEAKGLAPADAAVNEVVNKVQVQLGLVDALEKDKIKREQNLAKAKELIALGEQQVKELKLAEAADSFKGALLLLPPASQAPVIEQLGEVNRRLGNEKNLAQDKEAAEYLRQAKEQFQALQAVVAKDPLDGAIATSITGIQEKLALTAKYDRPPTGTAEVSSQLALLAQKVQDAQKTEAQRRQAVELAREAQQQLEAHQDDQARSKAEQALGLDPRNQAADKVRMEAIQRLAKAEEQRSKAKTDAELVDKAAKSLSTAQANFGRLNDLKGSLQVARGKVEELSLQYEGKPLESKAPLWEAHAAARAAEGRLTDAQSKVETEAMAAVRALDTQPEHQIRKQALNLLASYYRGHYDAACQAGDQVGQKAYLALLKGVEDPDSAAERGKTATLALRGTGTVTIRPLVIGEDTRLVSGAPPQVVTVPAEPSLAAGRWQLSDERGVVISVKLEAATRLVLLWPNDPPRIPGMELGYVPPPPGGKAFWMGRYEVTQEQYLACVNHPKVLPMVAAQVALVEKKTSAEAMLIQVPRTNSQLVSSIVWQFERIGTGQPITRFLLPPNINGKWPVTNIDRSDAEAYCAWLGETQGLTVRLPTKEEFRWACQAGDPDRHYPWGNVFDGAFAVTAMGKRADPAPVGSCPTDIGPFGHYDLAGNVREWLSGTSRQGAFIAGGAFHDDNPMIFQATYAESVPTETVNPAIGFRVVVEIR